VKGKDRLTVIDREETFRGSVANHLPLAVLGKDPQKNDTNISILEVEKLLASNRQISAPIYSQV
jgi:hypothetical protein